MIINGGLTVPNTIPLLSMTAIPVAMANNPTLASEIVWLGITVPNWIGWLFFILALIFGSVLSTFQDSTVDKYINYKKLKPLYAFGFGLFFTLFGIPLYWDNITVWQLILPAVISSTVGAQMVYYMISSGKYMLDTVFKKVGLEPLDLQDIQKNIDNKSGSDNQ